jgi:HNH endonuclease
MEVAAAARPGRARVRDSSGYVIVHVRKDSSMAPMRNANGYVREHRLVLAESLGRPLRRDEVVVHRNGVKDDNRLENLALLPSNSHAAQVRRLVKDGESFDEALRVVLEVSRPRAHDPRREAEAIELLRDALRHGSRGVDDVLALSDSAGISRATLRRARASLGVTGRNGLWSLSQGAG